MSFLYIALPVSLFWPFLLCWPSSTRCAMGNTTTWRRLRDECCTMTWSRGDRTRRKTIHNGGVVQFLQGWRSVLALLPMAWEQRACSCRRDVGNRAARRPARRVRTSAT